MPVEVKILPPKLTLKDVPAGEPFRRESDGLYFFKTNRMAEDVDHDACLCVTVFGFHLHRVRADCVVTAIPRAEITLRVTQCDAI